MYLINPNASTVLDFINFPGSRAFTLGQINGSFSKDKDRQGIKKLSDGPEWVVTVVRCKTFLWYLIRHFKREVCRAR